MGTDGRGDDATAAAAVAAALAAVVVREGGSFRRRKLFPGFLFMLLPLHPPLSSPAIPHNLILPPHPLVKKKFLKGDSGSRKKNTWDPHTE